MHVTVNANITGKTVDNDVRKLLKELKDEVKQHGVPFRDYSVKWKPQVAYCFLLWKEQSLLRISVKLPL